MVSFLSKRYKTQIMRLHIICIDINKFKVVLLLRLTYFINCPIQAPINILIMYFVPY